MMIASSDVPSWSRCRHVWQPVVLVEVNVGPAGNVECVSHSDSLHEHTTPEVWRSSSVV